ncbi:hypothetical protein SDC9_54234 [bioreactor metagenome]|uniref:DNA-(apurinic or apyrimidinic site) lyase n=1 Tax=bioreactor metagenome TaxID=1076179 RepID=A0A644X0V7_9ZZZZ
MLVTFIISQRKNIPAIKRSVEALAALFGRPVAGAPEGAFAFPSPEALAAQSIDSLAPCSLGYRAPYVLAAARMAGGGEIDLAGLESAGDEELFSALLTVPGVGTKVASCVMLFGYHRLDAFPRDTWINRTIDCQYGGCFEEERYRGFRGVIQQYMFYYARTNKG